MTAAEYKNITEAYATLTGRSHVTPDEYAALTGRDVVYLSAADLYPSATPPDGMPTPPKQFNGQDVRYFWADVLSVGDYRHPVTGARINLTAEKLDRLGTNLNLCVSRGVSIPAIVHHKRENSEGTIGYLFGAKREGSKLLALHGFIGEDAEKLAMKNRVSVGIDPDYKDAYGNRYGESIRHSALTPIPVIPGQTGFVPAFI